MSLSVIITLLENESLKNSQLTELFQHLVAFIENVVLQMLEVKLLGLDERQDSAGRADHNVGAVGLEHGFVLGDCHAAKENTDLIRIKS